MRNSKNIVSDIISTGVCGILSPLRRWEGIFCQECRIFHIVVNFGVGAAFSRIGETG